MTYSEKKKKKKTLQIPSPFWIESYKKHFPPPRCEQGGIRSIFASNFSVQLDWNYNFNSKQTNKKKKRETGIQVSPCEIYDYDLIDVYFLLTLNPL